MARRQLTLDNTIAAELAGSEDTVLRELEERLGCELFLRGNVLTLDGDDADVRRAATMVDELVGLVERGHDLAPATIDTVTGAIAAEEKPAEILEDVIWRHRATKVAPKTVNQKRYTDSIRRHTVTFGIGPAGTGKTFLAVAIAVAALESRKVSRIILTRPAVEAGERLGFLPGDIQAKVDPYLRPLFDALYDMLDPEKVLTYFDRGVIEVAPLAFMRGRTLNDSFVILDEAQNTSPEQMKMFLTRLGFGSKMVVTGDITQIDLPRDQRSGLVVVSEILSAVDDIAFVRFGGEDVVRHQLVQRIVAAYGEYAERDDRRVERSTSRTCPAELRPAVAAALEAAGVADGHLSVELVDAERIRELNRDHRGRDRAHRRALVPDRRRRPGGRPARARRRGDLPRAHRRPDRGGGPRRPPPLRLRPRDRRRRDARAPGISDARDLLRFASGDVAVGARTCVTRAGFIGLAGRPNVGKSTLVNAIVGAKVAIISDRPQTTRRASRGVATDVAEGWQLVLVDLPGVQRPRDVLTERMQRRVEHELEGADAVLLVVNAEQGIGPGDRFIASHLLRARPGVAGDLRREQDRPAGPR